MMNRDLKILAQEEFDLLVLGGGIYGATLAWDAVLRGLKVALVEKGDFASGTSANSLKIIHGGLRYLQHADFIRMRESITERRILLKIAPHLVFPMPCLMPTFGHAVKGPEVMRIGLLMNDIFSADRNRGLDKEHRLPNGKILSKAELLDLMPHVNRDDVNGGALWYDAHMPNSERLLLAFLHAAVDKGLVAANYVKAEKLLVKNGRVSGVAARDVLGKETFDIRAKLTISTLGPWINSVLAEFRKPAKRIEFSTAMNLVINRQLGKNIAFAAPTKAEFKDKDAIINKGARLLFFVPWRGKTLAGTAHKPYYGDAEDYHASETEVEEFLAEINSALPEEKIRRDEISHVYAGLLPMAGLNEESGDVQLDKHFRIIDHKQEDNLDGLLSVLTVKFTTARGVSEQAANKAVEKLGFGLKKSHSRETPIWGGDIAFYDKFIADGLENLNGVYSSASKHHLLKTYGACYGDVLRLGEENPALLQPIVPDSPVLKAEILYGLRHEMAQTLADVMLRRTELGTAGLASEAQINAVADLMAAERGWSIEKKAAEIENYKKVYKTI